MIIQLFNFSKKHNSTAVPDSTSGVELTVRLKSETSIWTPQFILSSDDIPTYNYVKWDDRYYFVSNVIKGNNNIVYIECVIDVLGTWRSDILSTTTFVERSSSSYNRYLNDNEVSVNQEISEVAYDVTTLTTSDGHSLFNGDGCYVVRCTSDDSDSVTGIATYIMTKTELASILSFLFNDSGTIWEAAWDSVTKAVFNPFQYILSIKWCAMNYSLMSKNLTSKAVKLGWWDTGINAKVVDYIGGNISWGLTVTNALGHYGDFRDTNPNYTKYKMYIPGTGLIEIPSIMMRSAIDIQLYYDVITGKSTWFLLYRDSNYVFMRLDGNVMADVQISQVNRDLGSAIGNAVGAVGMGLSGNAIGAVAGGVNAIGNILQPTPSVSGGASSMEELAAINSIIIYTERYRCKDEYFPVTRGRPLMQNTLLSTLSGFCQCGQASIDCDAPPQYKDSINNYINSGFYIE